MRVERTGTEILVGDWPPYPERTALVEARGALLAWDVLADAVPAARIHDLDHAADWLWEIYGSATVEILEIQIPDNDSRVRDAARVVAQLNWAEAWWPASVAAGVPTLDPVLLRAERAVAISEVEHLLDDDEATERALARTAQLMPNPATDALAARLVTLAEDYGVVLSESVVSSQADFALAAGNGERSESMTVLSGSNPVDWALVPSGVVDAAVDADWAVVRRQGVTYLQVAVALVGEPRRLVARFGQVEVELDRTDGLGRLIGQAPVAPTVLLLPPDQRQLTVYAPDFALPNPDPGSPARQAAIVAYAQSRPNVTLTERMANWP